MDLGTMRENLRQRKYQSREEFLSDVSQIFENSKLYNGEERCPGEKINVNLCPGENTNANWCPGEKTNVNCCPGENTNANCCPGENTNANCCPGEKTNVNCCPGENTNANYCPGETSPLTAGARQVLEVCITLITRHEGRLIALEKGINPLLDDDDQVSSE